MIIQERICKQCGHTWLPRTAKPIKCPSCQSMNWNSSKKDITQDYGKVMPKEEIIVRLGNFVNYINHMLSKDPKYVITHEKAQEYMFGREEEPQETSKLLLNC
jgi:LSD1 subclass zinc finger protein